MARRYLTLFLQAILATVSVHAAAVSVNGTCQVGNCTSPDQAGTATSPTTAFNFVVTLPNSDLYRIMGSINAVNAPSAPGLVSPFTATYLGNSTGTNSGADVLNIGVLQNFQLDFTLRTSTESAQGGFSGPLAEGSNVQIQLVISGQALPVVGPFPAPANFSFKSPSYTLLALGSVVLFDVRHTFTFAAGSGVGSTIYNALTPGASSGGTTPAEIACDSSSSAANCQAIVCDLGSGGTLPITNHPQALTRAASPANACDLVAFEGGGSTLPVLVFTDPTAPGNEGGSTLPVLVFEGGGSTLPVLYPTGPSGSGNGGVIAYDGMGSTLPVANSFESANLPAAADTSSLLNITTPVRGIASTYTAQATCPAAPTCWLTIPTPLGSIAASTRAAIAARIDPLGLAPGVYNANVALTISPAVGLSPSILLNIPVALAIAPPGPRLTLSQT